MAHSIETEEAPCGLSIAVGYMDEHIVSCVWCCKHVKKQSGNAVSQKANKANKANSLESLKAMFRRSK